MSEATDTTEPQHPGHRKDQQNDGAQESRRDQEQSHVPESDQGKQNEPQNQNDQVNKRDSETEARHHLIETYSGPSVHDMISTHTLAENIIKYGSQILDDENMALLKCFVNDPDSREQILTDIHIEDVDGVTGQYHGSLAGFIVMRHKSEVGETVEPVLTNDEIETLKEWFRTEEEGSATGHRLRGSQGSHLEETRKGS